MPFAERFDTIAARMADPDVGQPRPAPAESEVGGGKRAKTETDRTAAPTIAVPEAPALATSEELDELLDLSDAGLSVAWPPGWTETSARSAKRERPVSLAPMPKKPRVPLPEAVSVGGPTPVIARPKFASTVVAKPKRTGPAHDAAPKFGAGHDLRANTGPSGVLIWCRKCSRYGAERLRSDGLGGPCDPRRKVHTQLNRLISGYHPLYGHYLGPERRYERG